MSVNGPTVSLIEAGRRPSVKYMMTSYSRRPNRPRDVLSETVYDLIDVEFQISSFHY